MYRVGLLIVAVLVAQVDANQVALKHLWNSSVDKLVDKLVNTLRNRSFTLWPLNSASLENVTFGKQACVHVANGIKQHAFTAYRPNGILPIHRNHHQWQEHHRSGILFTSRTLSSQATQGTSMDRTKSSRKITSLKKLPHMQGPGKLITVARKRSEQVKPNFAIKNSKLKQIKLNTNRVDTYASSISTSLRDMHKEFRTVMGGLPPFQAQLADLTIKAIEHEGGRSLSEVENEFDLLRRSVVRSGKEAVAETSKASDPSLADELAKRGIQNVENTFQNQTKALEEMILTVSRLRVLPVPVLGEPIVVLVGMPNVGKSSLITATSTGKPEINSYPFTTRRLMIGHVIAENLRYQVMDTPGVLFRLGEERNPMEGLTLAAVEHLPSIVLFIMDLSGTSGPQSAPLLQLKVRKQILADNPNRKWFDVRTKADLPLAEEVLPEMIPQGALSVSAVDGTNIAELRCELTRLVGDAAKQW